MITACSIPTGIALAWLGKGGKELTRGIVKDRPAVKGKYSDRSKEKSFTVLNLGSTLKFVLGDVESEVEDTMPTTTTTTTTTIMKMANHCNMDCIMEGRIADDK